LASEVVNSLNRSTMDVRIPDLSTKTVVEVLKRNYNRYEISRLKSNNVISITKGRKYRKTRTTVTYYYSNEELVQKMSVPYENVEGYQNNVFISCGQCNSGKILVDNYGYYTTNCNQCLGDDENCRYCDGKGCILHENDPDEVECSRCGGTGNMRKVTFKKRKERHAKEYTYGQLLPNEQKLPRKTVDKANGIQVSQKHVSTRNIHNVRNFIEEIKFYELVPFYQVSIQHPKLKDENGMNILLKLWLVGRNHLVYFPSFSALNDKLRSSCCVM